MERDCKSEGCVVSALQNYTSRLIDASGSLPVEEHEQAVKFIIHFVSDLHQPLHTEDVAKGGNGIHVKFDDRYFNLHHVWDTSIVEKIVGGVRGSPYGAAQQFANKLVDDIRTGKFQAESKSWLDGISLDDVEGTALIWARESNAYVCTHGKLWRKQRCSVAISVGLYADRSANTQFFLKVLELSWARSSAQATTTMLHQWWKSKLHGPVFDWLLGWTCFLPKSTRIRLASCEGSGIFKTLFSIRGHASYWETTAVLRPAIFICRAILFVSIFEGRALRWAMILQ